MGPKMPLKRRATITSGEIEIGLQHLSYRSLVRPSSASGHSSKELSPKELLELCHGQLTEHLNDALKSLLEQTAPIGNEDALPTMNAIFETLSRESYETVAALADAMRESSKSQLKAQAAVYEMKLANSRTSATMQLQHQAVESQQVFEKQMKEKEAEAEQDNSLLDEANAKLADAHQQIEMMKMKTSGIQDALGKHISSLENQVKQGEGREKSLKDENNALERSCASLREESEDCKGVLNKALAELQLTVDDNKTLKERIQAVLDENETRRKEAEECNAMLDAALSELKVTVDDNRTLKERLQALVDENKEMQRQMQEAIQEMSSLRSEVDHVKSEVDQEKKLGEQLRAALDELKSKLERLTRERDAAQERLRNSSSEIADLTAERDRIVIERDEVTNRLSHEVEQLTTQRDQLQQQRDQLEEERGKLERKVKAVQKQLAELEAQKNREISALQDELSELKQKLKATQDELANVKTSLAEAEIKLKAAEEAVLVIEKLKEDLHASEQQIARLEGNLKELKAAHAAELQALDSNVKSLEASITSLTEELAKVKQASDEEVSSLKSKFEGARDEGKELAERLKAKEAELDEAKEHLKALLETGNGQNSQIKHWQNVADKLAKKLETIEQDLARCNGSLKEAVSSLNSSTKQNRSLGDHLQHLVTEIDRSREAAAKMLGGKAEAGKRPLDEWMAMLSAKLNELERGRRQIMETLDPAGAAINSFLDSGKSLKALQTSLIDRYHASQYTLERSEKSLIQMHETIGELRNTLERETSESAARLHELKDSARAERERLSKAAISSLELLRSHLAATLDGLKVSVPVGGLVSQERFDQIVANVELNRSPNKQRRLKHSQHPQQSQHHAAPHFQRTRTSCEPHHGGGEPSYDYGISRLLDRNPVDPLGLNASVTPPLDARKPKAKASSLHGSALSQALASARKDDGLGAEPMAIIHTAPLLRRLPSMHQSIL